MLTTLRANVWKYTAIALGLGLGFGLLMQTLRLAEAQLETAHTQTTLQTERTAAALSALKTSERYRKLGDKHRDEIAKNDTEAQAALAVADDGRARALDARNRMQRDLADYLTQHRTAAQARAAAGQCAPDTAPAELLADLQRRADDRAGELAHVADTARTRGLACERAYDSARAMTEAAQSGKTE
ncbi:hypothetical protein ASE39_21730 [Acidovorax sp. Root267]|uniref:DUF2514 family protein n=1 Tax=Acidovorax sp. Root267 TaxID=1736505 RepID=UPI0007089151|nr:DUF2514 family protein [Acidovorax sp. Root267]KRD25550.1 hypothetical protein ASE39_21730 [Acidovorax sp. Root267]